MAKVIKFSRRLGDGSMLLLGTAMENEGRWRFISNVSSHQSGRKSYIMFTDCIPRWVGYPHKCETEWIGFLESTTELSENKY